MSRVSYFQRFSQRENHATNNTLLLLKYFYEESPRKLQKVLSALIDVPVEIGLTFDQQVKLGESVPDGLIKQAPISIYIETKHGGGIWRDQVHRHINGMTPALGTTAVVLLLGLTKEPSSENEENALQEFARAKGVTYRGVTFSRILEELRTTCAQHDEALLRILDDYDEFLAEEDLLDERGKRMAVFACGDSFEENLKFGLYYDPPSRPLRRASLIGVYSRKTVIAVGRIVSVGIFTFSKGQITHATAEVGQVTQDQRERLAECIRDTSYYQLGKEDLRVYFVDKFEPTEIRKVSPGGVMSLRYLNTQDLLGDAYKSDLSTAALASTLRGRVFE